MVLNNLKLTSALIITSSIMLAACSDSDNDPTSTTQDVLLNFAAKVNDQDFTCGTTYTGVGSGGHDFKVTDYRMYIHDVHVHDADGNEVEVELTQDGIWQLDDVAMLDFENADDSADCNGTPEINKMVVGTVDASVDLADTEACFVVGLPFDKNHIDESTAASPLNASGMLWAWKIGRKYVRIDGVGDPAAANNAFNIHLGAQGDCGTGANNQTATQECTVPNTIEVCFDNFNLNTDVVKVDIAGVLEGNDISMNLSTNGMGPTTAKPGCQSFIDDDDCEEVMPRFGLNYDYGRSATGAASAYVGEQKMFSKQ